MMPYGLFGTPENLKENLPTFICSGFSAIYRENRGDGNDFLKLQILPLCFLPKDPQLESVRICRYVQDVTEIPVFQKPCCITEIKPCELAYLYPKYGDYCSRYLQEIARRNFIPSSLWAAIASLLYSGFLFRLFPFVYFGISMSSTYLSSSFNTILAKSGLTTPRTQ